MGASQRIPHQVRAILFDLDGTLRYMRPTAHEALLAFAQDLGYSFAPKAQSAGQRWEHAYWAQPEERIRADRERSGRDGFWIYYVGEYLRAMDLPEPQVEQSAAVLGSRFFTEFRPEGYLAPGAKEVLWVLRERGFQLGMLSNRREPLTGTAIELGIMDYFDFTLAAGQAGSRKPDPRIFDHALALAGGLCPQEAVYVGDNYYTDIIGARQAGLVGVLLDEYDIFHSAADECMIIRRLSDLIELLPSCGESPSQVEKNHD